MKRNELDFFGQLYIETILLKIRNFFLLFGNFEIEDCCKKKFNLCFSTHKMQPLSRDMLKVLPMGPFSFSRKPSQIPMGSACSSKHPSEMRRSLSAPSFPWPFRVSFPAIPGELAHLLSRPLLRFLRLQFRFPNCQGGFHTGAAPTADTISYVIGKSNSFIPLFLLELSTSML